MSPTVTAPVAPIVPLPRGWLITHSRATGTCKALAIPASRRPGAYHLVTSQSCDCIGFAYRKTCRHFTALKLYLTQIERAQIAATTPKLRLLRSA